MPIFNNQISNIWNENPDSVPISNESSQQIKLDNVFIKYHGIKNHIVCKLVASENGKYICSIQGWTSTDDRIDITNIISNDNIFYDGMYTGLDILNLTIADKILTVSLNQDCTYGLSIIIRPLEIDRDKIEIVFDKTDDTKYFIGLI